MKLEALRNRSYSEMDRGDWFYWEYAAEMICKDKTQKTQYNNYASSCYLILVYNANHEHKTDCIIKIW